MIYSIFRYIIENLISLTLLFFLIWWIIELKKATKVTEKNTKCIQDSASFYSINSKRIDAIASEIDTINIILNSLRDERK